jgi:TfoX/Sxy family transcriptional regulator of competence genes
VVVRRAEVITLLVRALTRSTLAGMPWQKIPKEHHPLFRAALPDDKRVETVVMFGGVAAKLHGNMFAGLWADSVMVRLNEADLKKAMAGGAVAFDPMGRGRPMPTYVVLPSSELHDKKKLTAWLAKSLMYALTLPPKEKKAAAKKSAGAEKSAGAKRSAGAKKSAGAKRSQKKK